MTQRIIKFRAWHKVLKEMICWEHLLVHCGYSHLSPFSDKDHLLMQFTGLTDCHGKEIYEGDIVRGRSKTYYSQKELENHIVEWTQLHDVDYPVKCFGFEFADGDLKVIGNVWENPELLDTKQ
jgi:CDGSH-type Zn-finger protein